jgi:hypothetical protein
MAKIKGVWVFNNAIKDKITGLDEDAVLDVLFTSNGTQFSSMCYLTWMMGDETFCEIYYNGVDSANNVMVVQGTIGGITDWKNEAYKTVDFGTTEQTVPDTFLSWMQENATQQASEGTTTPTAESVKTKLQSLLTASNAKTGKSDANLTDAVKTLLEGYGQGGESGGDCPINIVDELPETGEEGEIVGVKTFSDVFIKEAEDSAFMLDFYPPTAKIYLEKAPTLVFEDAANKSIEGGYDVAMYYLTEYGDTPDLYALGGTDFVSITGGAFNGEITDVAQAIEDGWYAYMGGLTLYQYTNGEFKELVPKIPSYDGTITVV